MEYFRILINSQAIQEIVQYLDAYSRVRLARALRVPDDICQVIPPIVRISGKAYLTPEYHLENQKVRKISNALRELFPDVIKKSLVVIDQVFMRLFHLTNPQYNISYTLYPKKLQLYNYAFVVNAYEYQRKHPNIDLCKYFIIDHGAHLAVKIIHYAEPVEPNTHNIKNLFDYICRVPINASFTAAILGYIHNNALVNSDVLKILYPIRHRIQPCHKSYFSTPLSDGKCLLERMYRNAPAIDLFVTPPDDVLIMLISTGKFIGRVSTSCKTTMAYVKYLRTAIDANVHIGTSLVKSYPDVDRVFTIKYKALLSSNDVASILCLLIESGMNPAELLARLRCRASVERIFINYVKTARALRPDIPVKHYCVDLTEYIFVDAVSDDLLCGPDCTNDWVKTLDLMAEHGSIKCFSRLLQLAEQDPRFVSVRDKRKKYIHSHVVAVKSMDLRFVRAAIEYGPSMTVEEYLDLCLSDDQYEYARKYYAGWLGLD